MSNGKFEIYTGKDGQYYFRLVAANGEKILRSEGYVSKSGCENGVQSVKENAPDDTRYKCQKAADEQYYFSLTAKNGEIIGVSETYTSKGGCASGIEAVKKTASVASVEEMV